MPTEVGAALDHQGEIRLVLRMGTPWRVRRSEGIPWGCPDAPDYALPKLNITESL